MPSAPRRPLVAGNWKMNGLKAAAGELARIVQGARTLPAVDVIVCPPATLIAAFAAAVQGSPVRIGAQDCHAEPAGAFTGDLAAEMLKDAGASAVIVGHSERRSRHAETDAEVRAKAVAAHRAGLSAIVCVGETRAEREAGRALPVMDAQLDGSLPEGATAENLVVAYEPVWAIGTGLTPTPSDVAEMHALRAPAPRSAFRSRRGGHPHTLRRIGEALERGRAPGRRRGRRRAGRRCEPAGRRVSGDRGRVPVSRAPRATMPAGIARGPADFVLRNGKVITVDAAFNVTQAIAVAGDRIIAVGADAAMAEHTAPTTHIVDLQGKPVIPGVNDGHAHMDREALRNVFPVARAGALDPRYPGSHRRAGACHAAGRMDRDDADRRASLLLRCARQPRRAALADAAGARHRRPRQSGLYPLDLGLLARRPSAGVVRQHRGSRAGGHHPRHRRTGRDAQDREGCEGRSDRGDRRARDAADRRVDLVSRGHPLHSCRSPAGVAGIGARLSRFWNHQRIRGPRDRNRGHACLQGSVARRRADHARLSRVQPELEGRRCRAARGRSSTPGPDGSASRASATTGSR